MSTHSNKNPILRAARTAMLACGLLAAGLVQASPVTYRFDMPAWTFASDASLFGSHAFVDVTLDNGGALTANQTYLNSDILGVRVWGQGGSLDLSFGRFAGDLSDSFISTDATGRALLDLVERSAPAVILSTIDAPWTAIQFGRSAPNAGVTPFKVSGDQGHAYVLSSGQGGLTVNGERLDAKSVPEPATWALSALALAAVFVGRRRKA
ncbi:MAG TPA: PEP-CTERM sorting domain-containing protein [Burkholderiaceae bacterium]|nr:PEP-CTERM sorting domain-containing protein [Burkholderiaceae bacterium]